MFLFIFLYSIKKLPFWRFKIEQNKQKKKSGFDPDCSMQGLALIV
jgi:hypothetical protein